jgi:hypothetical protein
VPVSSFEPERLYCTAGECLQEAALPGYATFELVGKSGIADHERLLTFSLPLCPHHAHLLWASQHRLLELNSGVSDPDHV